MLTFNLTYPADKPKLRNRINVSLRGYYGDMDSHYSLDDSFEIDAAEGIGGFQQVNKPEEFVMLVMCYEAMAANRHVDTIPTLYGMMAKMFPGFDEDTCQYDCPIQTEYDILPNIETFEVCYFDNNGRTFNVSWTNMP